jgi:hypothetical protein
MLLPLVPTLLKGALVMGAFGATYFAVAAALGLPEVGRFLNRFRRVR